MKHILKGMWIACLFVPLLSFSQSEIDALRYSQSQYGITARSFSMGGAFGALGADYSSIASNPAGIGVYRKSEFTFSMGFANRNTQSEYLNQEEIDNRFSFDIPNVGMVFAFPRKKEHGLKQFGFSLGYNRTANFNSSATFHGKNRDNSLLDSFIEDIQSYGGATSDDLYQDFAFDADLAYQTYLINPDTVDINQYITVIPDGDEYQSQHLSSHGGMGEFAIGFGGSVNDRVYFGVTLGFPSIRYDEESVYEERDLDNQISVSDTLNFKSFRYDQNLYTTGNGFNGKFGVILKPTDWIRFGAAIHTPTIFFMHDRYNSVMYSSFEGGLSYAYASPEGAFSYRLTTPFKAVGSLALLFGKIGLVSFDYEFTDYSMANLDATSSDEFYEYSFSKENATIEKAYNSSSNFRGGVELKYQKFSFRAGASYYGSPIKSKYTTSNTDQHVLGYTGGVGYRGKRFFFDIGYGHFVRSEAYSSYTLVNEAVPTARLVRTDNRIVTTFGIRF